MVKSIPRTQAYSTRRRKNFAPIKKYKDNRKPITFFNFSTQSSPSPNNAIVKARDQIPIEISIDKPQEHNQSPVTPFALLSDSPIPPLTTSDHHFVFQQSQEIATKNSIVKATNSSSDQFMPYSISAPVSSLRRTVSEPPKFISDLSPEEYSIIKVNFGQFIYFLRFHFIFDILVFFIGNLLNCRRGE